MLINNGTYKLALIMEDERIRLGGRLIFLFFNDYQIDEVFQDKVQSFSEPIEIYGLVEYSDGYDKAESESGAEITIDLTLTVSKISLDKNNISVKEGDYVKIDNRLKIDNLDKEENYDDYDTFTIKSVRPIVVENQYLDRVISYECELSLISSRNFEDEL